MQVCFRLEWLNDVIFFERRHVIGATEAKIGKETRAFYTKE
jgi:hypothetical protein